MVIYVNFTQGIDIAKKNNWDINNIVKIDDETNTISVKLASKGGYESLFFTDYKIDSKIEGNFLIINIKSKTDVEKTIDVIKDIRTDFVNKYGENPTYDFKNRELKQIEAALDYAKTHVVGLKEGKKCNCGAECTNYAQYILDASKNNNIDDPLILASIMIQESLCSGYDKCNEIGYCGLMQISQKISGWADPKTNINEGAKNLAKNYQEYFLSNSPNHPFPGKTTGWCGWNGQHMTEKCLVKNNAGVYSYEFDGCTNLNAYYSGWAAAVRMYNGWGCNPNYPSQDSYADNVMTIYEQLTAEVKNA